MPALLIAGLREGDQQRLLNAAPNEIRTSIEESSWKVVFYHSTLPKNEGLSKETQQDFLKYAARLDSPHICLFHTTRDPNRKSISAEIRLYFRIRILDLSLLTLIKSRSYLEFWEAIKRIIDEEEQWSNCIQPQGTNSPLLLPEKVFVYGNHTQIWELAQKYGSIEAIPGVKKEIENFKSAFIFTMPKPIAKKAWKDEHDHIFDYAGARHGTAPTPREWKFSFHIPDGFHFDVTHVRNRSFSISTQGGMVQVAANEHANIDQHGYQRE